MPPLLLIAHALALELSLLIALTLRLALPITHKYFNLYPAA